jgi:superoxide dismutase, Fe-Mn family
MDTSNSYRPKEFALSGLDGISDKTLEMHFKLYAGYVTETNRLAERIAGFLSDGKVDQEEMPAYSEIKRRMGFEYNGMVLHEYYFGNLKRHGGGLPAGNSAFLAAAEASFGSWDIWRTDFVSVAKMRGVGWAICYRDPLTGRLSNHWVTLHEISNIAGFQPILVVDVWEHAFLLDYPPSERARYVEACFGNIDWQAVEARMRPLGQGSSGNRR